MKKKSLILFLVACILFAFAAPVAADEYYTSADHPFYTVLVLDTSGSHGFNYDGVRIYTADTAINEVKAAATDFSNALLGLNGNHYVAVISYKGSATTVTGFTNDPAKVQSAIQGLRTSGNDCNISAGLIAANNLLSSISDTTAEKNVVVFTTGLTNAGNHSYSGIYGYNTPGSEWYKDNNGNGRQDSNDYRLFSYANVAYNHALTLHKQANVYTIGLFQNWDGMPAKGQELVAFFKQFTKDLAMPVENYTPVYSKSDLNNAFSKVCNNIINNPFQDVTYEGYYFKAVLWAEEKGITKGTSLSSFDPNEICTREQMVTFLWRAAGCPAPKTTTTPFADIDASRYSYQPILWATEKGITIGTSDSTFSPYDIVTREQVVTFLWRIAGQPETTYKTTFTDMNPARYSYNAVLWAQETGITVGKTATTFAPADPCTRGQIVTFLYRYYN